MLRDRGGRGIVLVTGAAGFLGLPLTRALRDKGWRIVAVDDGSGGTAERLAELRGEPMVVCRTVDVCDADRVRRVVAEEAPEVVVHLAARHFIPSCEERPGEALRVNVLGTQSLLDACAVDPPRRLLFASSGDIYKPGPMRHAEADPVGPVGVYGGSKLLGEWLLRDQAHRLPGCGITIARLFNVYGPGDGNPHLIPEVMSQVARGDRLCLGDVETIRDFVFVKDAVEALTTLLETEPGVYNVGTGWPTSGADLVALVEELTGRALRVEVDPGRVRRVTRRVLCADCSRLRVVAPWWPRTALRAGLSHTLSAAGLTGPRAPAITVAATRP